MSLNYSGSTVISLYLLKHIENSYFVGEPRLIFRINSNGAYKHHKFCTKCLIEHNDQICPIWSKENIARLRQNPGEYWKILNQNLKPDIETVIDSTKNLDWIKDNLTASPSPVVLHITKRVEDYIYSLNKRNQLKWGAGFHAGEWAKKNIEIVNLAKKYHIPYYHIKYQDFIVNPDDLIKYVRLNYGMSRRKLQNINPLEYHYVKGNPDLNLEISKINNLQIWKSSLSQPTQDKEIQGLYNLREVSDMNRVLNYEFNNLSKGLNLKASVGLLLFRIKHLIRSKKSQNFKYLIN